MGRSKKMVMGFQDFQQCRRILMARPEKMIPGDLCKTEIMQMLGKADVYGDTNNRHISKVLKTQY
jgi:hypothetical protein